MKKEKVYIRDLSVTGEGISATEKGVLFIDGALPKEEVYTKITCRKKNYSKGVLEELICASAHRIKPPCRYFGKCGGCQLQHADVAFQEEIKRNRVYQALVRIGNIKDPLVEKCIRSKKNYGYRNKITVPLIETEGRKKIGFFKKRSHEIVCVDTCKLHIPFADEIYSQVTKILLKSSLSFYNEKTKSGNLQHLIIRTSLYENKVVIGLIGLSKITEEIRDIAALISKIPNVKGVVYGKKMAASNSIYPQYQEVLIGEGELTEYILGFFIKISLLSFFQINRWCAETLYKKAFELADLKKGERVLDAYAGIGTFGIYLAKKGLIVTAIESFKKAVEDGRKNALFNKVEINFIEGEVEQEVLNLRDFDCVFINPPRKGIHEDIIEALEKISPKKIVYTSCDPATLSRDLKRLEEKGFCFKKAIPFDMFPQTMHVETIALLEKKRC